MKVAIRDFINWIYAKHNYLGGQNESPKGQIFDDGITSFIFDTWNEGILFFDEYLPIPTPPLFHNYKKNKDKSTFNKGYKIAHKEYWYLLNISRKDFNKELEKLEDLL